jgi:hypothetical protein
MNIKQILLYIRENKYQIQRIIALSCLLVFFVFMSYTVYKNVHTLKSIPTCIYGCDYYYENGVMMDLYNNPTHIAQSSTHDYLGFTNSIPKAHFYVQLVFAKIFGYDYFNLWRVYFLVTYFALFMGLIAWYYFYNRFFANPIINATLSILTISFAGLPLIKYSSLFLFALPLYLIVLFSLTKKENTFRKSMLLSIAFIFLFVLISNMHSMGLFIVFGLLLATILFFVIEIHDFRNIKKNIIDRIKPLIYLGAITLISLLILLLIGWHTVLITSGAANATKFDVHADLTNRANMFMMLGSNIHSIFFDFYSTLSGIRTVIFLLSILLFLLFFRHESNDMKKLVYWITFTFFALVFSYLITAPIIHKHLDPNHLINFLSPLLYSIMAGYLLYRLRHIKRLKILSPIIIPVCLVLMVVFSYFMYVNLTSSFKDKFWLIGYQDKPPQYTAFQTYIKTSHINPSNMIVLTTNELSFALNGVSGVKLFLGRQSHFFFFGDFQKLWMDGAILLYGNNSQSTSSLVDKYTQIAKSSGKELYLYWDYYWIQSEYQVQNNQTYPFDPLRFEYSDLRMQQLVSNGVPSYTEDNAIFEPSAQGSPYAYRMKILYVAPKYYNASHPWSPLLDPYLKKVWSYDYGGVEIAALYKFSSDNSSNYKFSSII